MVTHPSSESISSPFSERSQARKSASCTASSAAGRLPLVSATAATSRGYDVWRNSLIATSSTLIRSQP